MIVERNPIADQKSTMRNTAGYYAAFIAFGLMGASLGPSLPFLAQMTRTDFSQISMVFAARSFGFILGVYTGGRIFDKFHGHPLMAFTLFALAIVVATIPLVPFLWVLVLLILVAGVSVGIIEVGGNTLLVWIHKHNIGPWMNGLHLSFGIGAFLSPMIITHAIRMSDDIKYGFWVIAMIILIPGIWLSCLQSPPIPKTTKGERQERFDYALVIPISLIFLLAVGAEASFGGWIYTYSLTVHPELGDTAGYLTAGFWGALTIGRLLAIPVSMHLTPRSILWINFAGCLISIMVILIGSDMVSAVWVGTIGAGISMASIFPTLLTFTQRRMKITGKVNSWFFTGAGLGGMTLPWIIGQLFVNFGAHSIMATLLIDLLVALAVFYCIMRIHKTHPDS